MDITGDLGNKIQAAVAQLPAELQPIFDGVLVHLSAMEKDAIDGAAAIEKQTAADAASDLSAVLQQLKPFSELAARINGGGIRVVFGAPAEGEK